MISIDGNHLKLEEIAAVARRGEKVEISAEAEEGINKAREMVYDLVEKGEAVYGVTTGFGKLGNVTISKKESSELQKNLIRSHTVGVGENLPEDVVRALMLLRINALAKGYSGIRIEVLQLLVDMLNSNIHPVIPSQGSVGASGDLIPLSHMALTLLGEGKVHYKGEICDTAKAFKKEGLYSLELVAKEGLALINGTAMMTAIAALAVHDSEILIETADIAAAMSVEAFKGIDSAFDEDINKVRPHPGQIKSADNLRDLLRGSELTSSNGQIRVQDPYSFRCIPQVHGASRDALDYVRKVVETELNAATDNPLFFPEDGKVISAGNFHGQPLALAMDVLGIALSECANIANSRVSQLLTEEDTGLPPFLIEDSGLNTGLMLTQYTTASLVSENKVLSSPASVDSITTSGTQEDFNSMGSIAARKVLDILKNVVNVTAIELFCAAQAVEFHFPGKMGQGTRAAYECIRERVSFVKEDRVMDQDVNAIAGLVRSGKIYSRTYEKIQAYSGDL